MKIIEILGAIFVLAACVASLGAAMYFCVAVLGNLNFFILGVPVFMLSIWSAKMWYAIKCSRSSSIKDTKAADAAEPKNNQSNTQIA